MPDVPLFRPGAGKKAMNAVDALREKQPLESHPRIEAQQTDIFQSTLLTLRLYPGQRFTDSLPAQFHADVIVPWMRQGVTDKEFSETGTDLHFQGSATAELLVPKNRSLKAMIGNNRTEQE